MKYSIKQAKEMDKFYTHDDAVSFLVNEVENLLSESGSSFVTKTVIEPSAGGGAFLPEIMSHNPKNLIAMDIAPESDLVKREDFLEWSSGVSLRGRGERIVIGNPPFGKKGLLALDFLNRSLDISEIVAMILPVTFRKWSVHKGVVEDARLLFDERLPDDSFTLNGEEYSVRCCAQIWVKGDILDHRPDLRMTSAPPTSHPDFECWQYNATVEARKFFDYDWDFAVLRQGYGDYTRRITDKRELNFKNQWIFFKAKNEEILDVIMRIDYDELSRTNTSVRGFGKAQVVAEYVKNKSVNY